MNPAFTTLLAVLLGLAASLAVGPDRSVESRPSAPVVRVLECDEEIALHADPPPKPSLVRTIQPVESSPGARTGIDRRLLQRPPPQRFPSIA